ncbi:MAG: alkaline phosphatase family protein [Phycisphaeraceae bacterium]|nr:alkaline phosphatase family protein [Phycisphaeraceae bacterium]
MIVISVDGLRSDAMLILTPRQAPALHRLMAASSTLNARTDPDYTITLPNHTAMLTGRPTLGERGHGWTDNGDPPEGETLHTRKGEYVAGTFDAAAAASVRTGLIANKSKFILYARSWGAHEGDESTPPPATSRTAPHSNITTARRPSRASATTPSPFSPATQASGRSSSSTSPTPTPSGTTTAGT